MANPATVCVLTDRDLPAPSERPDLHKLCPQHRADWARLEVLSRRDRGVGWAGRHAPRRRGRVDGRNHRGPPAGHGLGTAAIASPLWVNGPGDGCCRQSGPLFFDKAPCRPSTRPPTRSCSASARDGSVARPTRTQMSAEFPDVLENWALAAGQCLGGEGGCPAVRARPRPRWSGRGSRSLTRRSAWVCEQARRPPPAGLGPPLPGRAPDSRAGRCATPLACRLWCPRDCLAPSPFWTPRCHTSPCTPPGPLCWSAGVDAGCLPRGSGGWTPWTPRGRSPFTWHAAGPWAARRPAAAADRLARGPDREMSAARRASAGRTHGQNPGTRTGTPPRTTTGCLGTRPSSCWRAFGLPGTGQKKKY
jgi:hypothetical protein